MLSQSKQEYKEPNKNEYGKSYLSTGREMGTVCENEQEYDGSEESQKEEESQTEEFNVNDNNLETFEENHNQRTVEENPEEINTLQTFVNNEKEEERKEETIDNIESNIIVQSIPQQPVQYNSSRISIVEKRKPERVVQYNSSRVTIGEERKADRVIIASNSKQPFQPTTLNSSNTKPTTVNVVSQPRKVYSRTPKILEPQIIRRSPQVVKRYQTEQKQKQQGVKIYNSPQVKENDSSFGKSPITYLKANVKRRFVIGENGVEESYSTNNNMKVYPKVERIVRETKKIRDRSIQSSENSEYEEPVYYGYQPVKL